LVIRFIPVAASTIRRRVVMNAKTKIAPARTERVAHFLTKGTIKIAPTH